MRSLHFSQSNSAHMSHVSSWERIRVSSRPRLTAICASGYQCVPAGFIRRGERMCQRGREGNLHSSALVWSIEMGMNLGDSGDGVRDAVYLPVSLFSFR